MGLDDATVIAARLYYEKLMPSKLSDHLHRLSLPAAGIEYVLRASNEPPSRLVTSGRKGNNIYRYPSKLMAYTLQCESSIEYRWLIGAHFNENETLWVWDQPPRLYVSGTNVNGDAIRTGYTGDFLRIEPHCVRMYEIKSDEDLLSLARERPLDWVLAGDNRWHYLPAERECKSLGIIHEVVEGSKLPMVLAENHELLIRARESQDAKTFSRLRAKVQKLLIKTPVIRLSELADRVDSIDITPFLKLVCDGLLVSDLNRFRLSLPESSWVSSSIFTMQSWVETQDRIRSFTNEAVSVQEAPRPVEVLRIALRRKLIETGDTSTTSERTLYRIRAIDRESGGDPRKLATHYANCGQWGEGPHLSRVGRYQESLIAAVLRKYYFTADAIPKRSAYAIYEAAFDNRKKRGRLSFSGKPVSPNTFYDRIDRHDSAEGGFARGGRREQNANFHPTSPEHRELEATRPFQRSHFDHYQLDRYAALIRTATCSYCLKPWASVLRDSYTKKPLAFTLRFGDPSRASVARVLRDCVRRHGRLPEFIKFDGGSEFRSVFVEELLAESEITKCTHGPEMARGSAELERLFGTYSNPDLYGLGKKAVSDVREDCETNRVVYAAVNGKWITCFAGPSSAANAIDRISVHHEQLRYWFPDICRRIIQMSDARIELKREMNKRWVNEYGMPGLYDGLWPTPDAAVRHARASMGLSQIYLDDAFGKEIDNMSRDQLISLKEIVSSYWTQRSQYPIKYWTNLINRRDKTAREFVKAR